MSNIVLARLGENIKASTAGDIIVSSGATTAPTFNALVGSIALFAGTTAPNGWLKCDGTGNLSRSQYLNLWNFANSSNNIVDETTWLAGRIGSFSTGNGSTTFRIPDLRGEFVRALADGKAVDTGRVIGTAQADDFKSHSHLLKRDASGAGATGGDTGNSWNGSYRTTETAGGTETRPRNIALLYCIKF
jgi:microcystin-dependent protein